MLFLILLLILLSLIVVSLIAYVVVEKKKYEVSEEKLLRAMFAHDKVAPKDELLTQNEQRFYKDLEKRFGDRYYVFSQVSFPALLKIKDEHRDLYERSLISKFYFDFVLCAKNSFRPVMVVELNDKSHGHQKRKERDEYFSKMLASINIKFLSFESNYLTYDHHIEEVAKVLQIK